MTIKLPFWATFFTLAGLCVLIALGTWQLQRLEWKEGLLHKIESRSAEEFTAFKTADFVPENEFSKGEITGRFLNDKEFLITPRTHDGKPGMHVITPFQMQGSSTVILVNRGWTALDQTFEPANSSIVDVAGMVRTVPEPNIFTPNNTPEQDSWYWVDLEAVKIAKDIQNLAPVMLYEIDLTEGAHGTIYPDPNALQIHLNNNHLQYAFFWFAMAGVLLIVYGLRFLKPKA